MATKNIIKDIIVDKGYHDKLKVSQKETKMLYGFVKESLLEGVTKNNKKLFKKFKKINLKNYHKYSHLVDHKTIMQGKNRIIKPKNTLKIKKMLFYKKLENIFSGFKILSFENTYKDEVYWRIVRPNKNDAAPLHQDFWFWSLNKRHIKKKFTRIKIWIPIICEKGLNGLRYVHRSHLIKFDFTKKNKGKDGLLRPPVIKKKINAKIFKSDIGQSFIFNDKLIHGGLSGGKYTRVSLEFTMLVDDKVLRKHID